MFASDSNYIIFERSAYEQYHLHLSIIFAMQKYSLANLQEGQQDKISEA